MGHSCQFFICPIEPVFFLAQSKLCGTNDNLEEQFKVIFNCYNKIPEFERISVLRYTKIKFIMIAQEPFS